METDDGDRARTVADKVNADFKCLVQQIEYLRIYGCASSKTFAFWDELLHLIDLLLSLIKADRDGNWQLLLDLTAGIIPFVTAAGHRPMPRIYHDTFMT